MGATRQQLDRSQQQQRARFERMGLETRTAPDGRSLLVSLPLGPAPLETMTGPMKASRVLLATVGTDRFKCLRPKPLFVLPILGLADCADATDLEWKVRSAWRDHTRKLRDLARTLEEKGLAIECDPNARTLLLPLEGEMPNTRVHLTASGEAILPSIGPLAGLALASRQDRVVPLRTEHASATEIECELGGLVHERAREARKRLDEERTRAQKAAPTMLEAPQRVTVEFSPYEPRVLLVGPRVIDDESLRSELNQAGFRIEVCRGEAEALTKLARMSPEVVIAQYDLGRSDGASFVQAMHGLTGIERIPVVLVDEEKHSARRAAAKAVGAVGYVPRPFTAERFVERLTGMAFAPQTRRFTRYHNRLSVRLEGLSRPELATQVGRGGVFLATARELPLHARVQGRIALPELQNSLRFASEVIYLAEAQGAMHQGLGLRFVDMHESDEQALIEYLAWIEEHG